MTILRSNILIIFIATYCLTSCHTLDVKNEKIAIYSYYNYKQINLKIKNLTDSTLYIPNEKWNQFELPVSENSMKINNLNDLSSVVFPVSASELHRDRSSKVVISLSSQFSNDNSKTRHDSISVEMGFFTDISSCEIYNDEKKILISSDCSVINSDKFLSIQFVVKRVRPARAEIPSRVSYYESSIRRIKTKTRCGRGSSGMAEVMRP